MESTDEQLVKNYLNGDETSLNLLILRYLSPLYNFIFKYLHLTDESEDTTQEAFVKIWKNLHKFDHTKKFKTWAFTIAKNTALDHLKKKGLVAFSDLNINPEMNFEDSLVSHSPLPEEIMMGIEDMQVMGHAVNQLPINYQRIISLYYQDQLNFREIAELLKESINTVKTRHRRAVILLKRNLQDK